MSKTAEQVRVLRAELQGWVEKNGFSDGVKWLTPEEFYRDSPQRENVPSYLVLISGDELCDVIWGGPPGALVRPDAERLRAEFGEIVTQHGFEFDSDEGNTACFLCAEEVQADYDRGCARAREAHERMEAMVAAGWRRDGEGSLVHPEDTERWVIYDPFKEEFLYSPKEAALRVEEIRRKRGERQTTGEKIR